jgi:SAM-dependent methyltransferase
VTPGHISPQAYRLMREVEDTHWWFDGMERISGCLLDAAGFPAAAQDISPPRILDAGCGTGRSLAFLARRGTVTGIDYSPIALSCCRERGLSRLLCGSVNALPFAGESFDLVACFDVLTHSAVDETRALREFARVLRPGGRLLLRVAAYDWLRGRHDAEWAIGRRYGRQALAGKLAAAGFRVRQASYANFWLLPAVLLKRLAEHWWPPRAGTSDLQLGARRSLAARFLAGLLASEAPWAAGPGLPWGLSLFALAERKD